MHSGYELPGRWQPAAENDPVLLSMKQAQYFPGQFLDQAHNLPPQTGLSHHYIGGGQNPAYFPAVNFNLGLNEICLRNNDCNNNNNINHEEVDNYNMIHGSKLHCWQNQSDSPPSIVEQPLSFWEHLSIPKENSEIVEMNHKEQEPDHHLRTCLDDAKSKTHFGELEAIYAPLGTAEVNQTSPCEKTDSLPGTAARPPESRKKWKKNARENNGRVISPMVEFFESLLRQVVEHQEKMHRKLGEVLERMEEERVAREEDWRRQELARLEQESKARAREKARARDREAVIVSYLEKITGERVGICSDPEPMEIGIPTDDVGRDDLG